MEAADQLTSTIGLLTRLKRPISDSGSSVPIIGITNLHTFWSTRAWLLSMASQNTIQVPECGSATWTLKTKRASSIALRFSSGYFRASSRFRLP